MLGLPRLLLRSVARPLLRSTLQPRLAAQLHSSPRECLRSSHQLTPAQSDPTAEKGGQRRARGTSAPPQLPSSRRSRITLIFKKPNGELETVQANEGDDIVDVSWEYDLDIEGTSRLATDLDLTRYQLHARRASLARRVM